MSEPVRMERYHSYLQSGHQQRGDVSTVSHGERPLGFQCVDEGEEEHLVVEQLAEETQRFLHVSWRLRRKTRGQRLEEDKTCQRYSRTSSDWINRTLDDL